MKCTPCHNDLSDTPSECFHCEQLYCAECTAEGGYIEIDTGSWEGEESEWLCESCHDKHTDIDPGDPEPAHWCGGYGPVDFVRH